MACKDDWRCAWRKPIKKVNMHLLTGYTMDRSIAAIRWSEKAYATPLTIESVLVNHQAF